MSEQSGLTVDETYVDNGDYFDDSDEPPDRKPNPRPPEKTDRSSYLITRPADGSSNHPLHVDYGNGESVEFVWDNNGNLMSVIDTSSGTRMINTADGWYMENARGERTKIDGTVSVDDSTAAITIQMNDGSKTTIQPDGRVLKQDADGNLVAVSVDKQLDPQSLLRNDPSSRSSFSDAQYDADHNLTGVTDQYGNRFELQDGRWYLKSQSGDIPVSGDVVVDNYGMAIVPRRQTDVQQPAADQ